MHPYIEKFKAHIPEQQPEDNDLLDMLYQCCIEEHPIGDIRTQSLFATLDTYFLRLSPQEQDGLLDLICGLCCEHERLAFLEGIRVGFRLADELDA